LISPNAAGTENRAKDKAASTDRNRIVIFLPDNMSARDRVHQFANADELYTPWLRGLATTCNPRAVPGKIVSSFRLARR
jgi:hypothetical protein